MASINANPRLNASTGSPAAMDDPSGTAVKPAAGRWPVPSKRTADQRRVRCADVPPVQLLATRFVRNRWRRPPPCPAGGAGLVHGAHRSDLRAEASLVPAICTRTSS